MKRTHGLFDRLRVRRRPPSGPLTTAETKAAEESQENLRLKDAERIEAEQEDSR